MSMIIIGLGGGLCISLGAAGIGFEWGAGRKAPGGAVALWAVGCFMVGYATGMPQ